MAVLTRWQGPGFPSLDKLTGRKVPVRKMAPDEVKGIFAAMRDGLHIRS